MEIGLINIPSWHHPMWGFFVFIIGCCLGSFFNVCIYRIPLGLSIVSPKSRCSTCGIPLKAAQNIPIIGWWRTQGWCSCKLTRIDSRYWIVELGSGLLFLGLWMKVSLPLFFIYAIFLSGLIIASLIDVDYYIIPDRFSIGGVAAGLILSAFFPALHGVTSIWVSLKLSLIGAFVGCGILGLVAWFGKLAFKKDAMGMGDVKLLAAMGSFLGWESTLFILASSSLIGSVIGLLLMRQGPTWCGSRLPFGPYLSLGAAVWIFGGSEWVSRYWTGIIQGFL